MNIILLHLRELQIKSLELFSERSPSNKYSALLDQFIMIQFLIIRPITVYVLYGHGCFVLF